MSKYRVTDINTLELHCLGDKALLTALFRSYGSPPNSDFSLTLMREPPSRGFLMHRPVILSPSAMPCRSRSS